MPISTPQIATRQREENKKYSSSSGIFQQRTNKSDYTIIEGTKHILWLLDPISKLDWRTECTKRHISNDDNV